MLGLLAKTLIETSLKAVIDKKQTKTLKATNSIPMKLKQCAMNENRT